MEWCGSAQATLEMLIPIAEQMANGETPRVMVIHLEILSLTIFVVSFRYMFLCSPLPPFPTPFHGFFFAWLPFVFVPQFPLFGPPGICISVTLVMGSASSLEVKKLIADAKAEWGCAPVIEPDDDDMIMASQDVDKLISWGPGFGVVLNSLFV